MVQDANTPVGELLSRQATELQHRPKPIENTQMSVIEDEAYTSASEQDLQIRSTDTNFGGVETLPVTQVANNMATLPVPEPRYRSRSVSTVTSERSQAPIETQITMDDLLPSAFQRRHTGTWFSHGKVFEISGQHHDRTIAKRGMVVIARSRDIVCLPICRYQHVTKHNTDFWRRRLLLRKKGTTSLLCAPSVEMEIGEGLEILDDVWINCEKPYTIHYNDMDVAYLGDLTEDALATLTKVYLQTQGEMVKIPEPPRSIQRMIWDTIIGFFGFGPRKHHTSRARPAAL
ncbi:hypothetical protein JX265_007978 [Neoarthrinium moseri]|uniref:Uncharacterized protein n=1 Tax=Neoarthrinium moseri TaxID=1658444 RepID=A0A9P9WIT8_9PEZI|nr:hypothetical protein JX265_007978 [Neoarthrinium moseri]